MYTHSWPLQMKDCMMEMVWNLSGKCLHYTWPIDIRQVKFPLSGAWPDSQSTKADGLRQIYVSHKASERRTSQNVSCSKKTEVSLLASPSVIPSLPSCCFQIFVENVSWDGSCRAELVFNKHPDSLPSAGECDDSVWAVGYWTCYWFCSINW